MQSCSAENKMLRTQNHKFACCFVWVWKFVSYIEGKTYAQDILEYGAEVNVWVWMGRKSKGVEKITRLEALLFVGAVR